MSESNGQELDKEFKHLDMKKSGSTCRGSPGCSSRSDLLRTALTMPYDVFISYSRRDNECGQVAALVEQIKSAFRTFAGRELSIFFDKGEIKGMDDWRQKIQHSLRKSHLFLAVLSPSYLASPYCGWEWEDYVRHEAMRQWLGEGVAPVFFVTLPNAADPLTDRDIARWLDEIYKRQTFDLSPSAAGELPSQSPEVIRERQAIDKHAWHDAGEKALEQIHNRGRTYSERQFDRAIDAILQQDSLFAVSAFSRGLARIALRDLDGAIVDFESAVALDPTNTSFRDQLDEAKAVRATPSTRASTPADRVAPDPGGGIPRLTSDADRALRLDLEHQQALERWKALPFWQRLRTKRPEPPAEI